MKGKDKCSEKAERIVELISVDSLAEANDEVVARVVRPTFFEEPPRASFRAFLFVVFERGLSFSLSLLLAEVDG